MPETHHSRPPLARYILMCKNSRVAAFDYNPRTRSVKNVEPLDGAGLALLGVYGEDGAIDRVNLGGWLGMRYIPHGRAGLSQILRDAGCADPAELMFSSLALNLSDQYWVRPAGVDIDWHDVNYFENPYVDGRRNNTASGGWRGVFGPGTSTAGQVRKWWERREDGNYLVKGSLAYDHEPYAELLATMLYERVLEPGTYVRYTIEEHRGTPCSACRGFIDTTTELATMDDVLRRFGTGYPATLFDGYVRALEEGGVIGARRSVSETVVLDFLMGNTDRHEYNLGVVLDADSKRMLRAAPIFDNGRSFYGEAKTPDELTGGLWDYEARPFDADPLRQLSLVGDVSWLDLGPLEGFSATVRDVLASNPAQRPWFADAAARQFELRLAYVRGLQRAART